MRCVYIAECLGKYKIGWSSNLPLRIQELDKSCPYVVRLIHSFESPTPKTTEHKLHKKYKHRHIKHEWYRLTQEDLKEIIGA